MIITFNELIELKDKLKRGGVLKDYYFGFSLCTGIAVIHKLTSGYRITISDGQTKDADSILCALNKLSRVSRIAGKSKGFKFELQEAQQKSKIITPFKYDTNTYYT